MRFDAPFKLGPFLVDAEGRLSPSEPANAPAFVFRSHDRVVRARLNQAGPAIGSLTLQVKLARIRSTASTLDEGLRPRCFALLHWLEKQVPAGWRLNLLIDHRVWLESVRPIGLPITAVALVTELTEFTLALAPYLELMDEDGLTLSDTS